MTVESLSCSEDIFVGRNPKVGHFVACNGCDSQFEIVDVDPIMVDWPDIEDDFVDMYGYCGDKGSYDDMDDSEEKDDRVY